MFDSPNQFPGVLEPPKCPLCNNTEYRIQWWYVEQALALGEFVPGKAKMDFCSHPTTTLKRLSAETRYIPFLIAAKGNPDPMWGQLTVTKQRFNRFGFVFAGKIGLGSVLVAVAQKRGQ